MREAPDQTPRRKTSTRAHRRLRVGRDSDRGAPTADAPAAERRPLCIRPVLETREGAQRWLAPSAALAQRLPATFQNAALCKSEAGGRSGRTPTAVELGCQHDASASRDPHPALQRSCCHLCEATGNNSVQFGNGCTRPLPLINPTDRRTGESDDAPVCNKGTTCRRGHGHAAGNSGSSTMR